MKVQLTKKQRKMIKRAVKIQLESLWAILNDNVEEDIPMFCIEHGFQKEALMNLVERNIRDFSNILHHPEEFLNLPEVHLSTLTHILYSNVPQGRSTRQLQRKLLVLEQLEYNPN